MLQKEKTFSIFKGDRMAVAWYSVKIVSNFLVSKKELPLVSGL